ncbi:DUF5700 domain-containing putative Zn-dependent protease [Candidatus Hodarchaeum mangrovi]
MTPDDKEPYIKFSTSTLEKIIFHPEDILKREEEFWENERAQWCTKLWAKNVNYEINFDEWRDKILFWSKLSENKRQKDGIMKNSRKIIEGKELFLNKALPHLFSYSPRGSIENYDVTIQFTAFNPTHAFAMEDIVIDISAPYWQNNLDIIYNTLIHELFHCCYSWCRDHRTEGKLNRNDILNYILDNFQSEGICTFVGYKAQHLFPASNIQDYTLLENEIELKRLLNEVNKLFLNIGKLSDEELKKIAWNIGVIKRGYYVVGAHICQIIDEKVGRNSLLETLTTGPFSWIRLYNTLVNNGMKIQLQI